MKLLNYTLLLLSLALFAILSLWSVLFYFQMLNQVKASIDDGLANYKILIIDQVKDDTLIVQQDDFLERNFIIREVSDQYALQVRDTYKDTLIYSSRKNIYEPTRLLTTAFAVEDGRFYEMKVISPVVDKNELIKKVVNSLIWLYLALLISIILMNNFVLKRTWKPFYRLLDQLKNFSLGEGSIFKSSKTRIKEFAVLDKTILKLLTRNVDIYQSQKHFIENASHELQTPLAISMNKLELLAETQDLSEDQIQYIGSISQTLERLSSLNKSLLLLSKIENKQFVDEEHLSFNEIFRGLTEEFSDYAEYRKIEIIFNEEDNWIYHMNKDLAGILAMNLLKNAIVHNYPGGELVINISSSFFTIENTGNDSGMDPDKLFERFNKNPDKRGSTGLGLAIVKAIADASGLSVFYSFTGRHVLKVGQ
ncbi:sensor histidine kinase [Bacteroidota bacterium]